MVSRPADVSSAVLAVPVGSFEPVGAVGGCVEPVAATEHHGSSAPCAGLTALERVEAELDRRERALALLLAPADGAIGSKHTTRTYSDISKRSIYSTRVAKAVVGLALAGVPAQSAAASGVSTKCILIHTCSRSQCRLPLPPLRRDWRPNIVHTILIVIN